MLTNAQRELVTRIALQWVGTPYRPCSSLKGAGVDCGQFLAAVYQEAGLVPKDVELPNNYSVQVWQHKEDTTYLDIVSRFAREIPESEVLPADIVVYKLGKGFAHGAIIVHWDDFIIHALEKDGVTGGHGNNTMLAKRERKFFTLKDGVS